MTTLVTGAFGCIGAWVVRGLLADGERPVAFDLGDDPWRMRMIVGPDAATLVHEVVVAMNAGDGTVDNILRSVYVHPALSEVVQRAAGALAPPREADAWHARSHDPSVAGSSR